MEERHLSLAHLYLNYAGFQHYRCDKPLTLGISIESLYKILKCAGAEDSMIL